MTEKSCPECGCPITNETSCPECGYPFLQDECQEKEDYNEGERYSPFNADGWFFSLPYPISKYPNRGDYAAAHPFGGWLFQAWHISDDGNGRKNAIDALNNLFLLFNLQWKLFMFPVAWVFFKLMWWIVTLCGISILLPVILDATGAGYETTDALMTAWWWICGIGGVILIVLGCILYFCGFAESFRRYWPVIYDTFMRLCKRFGISVTKSIKTNDINE